MPRWWRWPAGVLESLGLASFRLDLGHSGFFQGLVESVTDSRLAGELKEALLAQDYVRYEAVVKESGLEHDRQRALLALPTLRGEGEVLDGGPQPGQREPAGACGHRQPRFGLRLVKAWAWRTGSASIWASPRTSTIIPGLLIEGYTPSSVLHWGAGVGTIRWWAGSAKSLPRRALPLASSGRCSPSTARGGGSRSTAGRSVS